VRSNVLSPKATRRVFAAGVFVQMGIVVTGGLVRLTGSGLGCPDWPQCVSGSLTPVVNQPQGYHKLIEFGNRSLTFVVVAVAVACLYAAWQQAPRRRPLVVLAAASVGGVFAQAVLGGLTVLFKLNPYLVASHFLLSTALIAVALALYERSGDAGDGPPEYLVRSQVTWLVRALVVLALAVIVLGTLVTGSGPHSGDADHPSRTGLNVARMAWLHADTVTAFCLLLIGTLVALRVTGAPKLAQGRARLVLYVTVAQAVLGYVQYYNGVPWVLVAFHVLGATLLWATVLRLTYAIRTRGPRAEPAPQPAAVTAATAAAANRSGAPGA
jgi:heme a synthase